MSFEATPTETEQVREICGLSSVAYAASLILRLSDEQWERTQEDIELWEAVKDDDVEVVGGLLGANISANATRLRICNRVRERLGLSPLRYIGQTVEAYSSPRVRVIGDW